MAFIPDPKSRALLFDVTRCIGCRACAQACKESHGFSGTGEETELDATTTTEASTVTSEGTTETTPDDETTTSATTTTTTTCRRSSTTRRRPSRRGSAPWTSSTGI